MALLHGTRRNMMLLFVILAILPDVFGVAFIEIHFTRYSDNCREDGGLSKCDPKFTFCLDRPRTRQSISPCYYKRAGESSHYQDTNTIDLASKSSIGGIGNPWLVRTKAILDESITLAVRVRDDDYFGDDHLETWAKTLNEIIYPSRDEANWASRSMTRGGHTLWFKIRLYCEANYYLTNCTKFCKAQDLPTGHYTCERGTGNRICMRGWTGPDCTEDIDECALNFCERGNCENLEGDYICHCPVHYTGKNCTAMEHPCDKQDPCLNGGTCIPGSDPFSYMCNCSADWEGQHCELVMDPCKFDPCQNGAKCVSNANHTDFVCQGCKYPFTGDLCEERIASTSVHNGAVHSNVTKPAIPPTDTANTMHTLPHTPTPTTTDFKPWNSTVSAFNRIQNSTENDHDRATTSISAFSSSALDESTPSVNEITDPSKKTPELNSTSLSYSSELGDRTQASTSVEHTVKNNTSFISKSTDSLTFPIPSIPSGRFSYPSQNMTFTSPSITSDYGMKTLNTSIQVDLVPSNTTTSPVAVKQNHVSSMIDATTTTEATDGGPKTGQSVGNDDDGGFEHWYVIVICIAFLLIIIIIIICLVARRRRKKQKKHPVGLPEGNTNTVVVFSGDNLTFENGMYNDVNRNGSSSNGGLRQQPPLVTTPTDDDLFNPVKPVFCPDDVESQGAVGGRSPYHDMDADGYVKPSSLIKAQSECQGSPATDRAADNHYADFHTLKSTGGDEGHYQDLDETAIEVRKLNDLEAPVRSSPINLEFPHGDRADGPYTDKPSNIAVLPVPGLKGLNDSDFSQSSVSDDEFDDNPIFGSAPRQQEDDGTYTDPIPKSSRDQQPQPTSTFKEGPYADVPIVPHTHSNPFADNGFEEDDELPNLGLPPINNAGYDTPTGSMHGHPPFTSQDSQYDKPSNNQPADRTSATTEYDSPRSSNGNHPIRKAPAPPIPAPKPPVRSISNKLHPAGYENLELNGNDEDHSSQKDLPIAPPVPPKPQRSSDHTDGPDTENFPRSISVREGYTFDSIEDPGSETNVDDALDTDQQKSNPAEGLFFENHIFS